MQQKPSYSDPNTFEPSSLNPRARAYQARRKTKPMTESEIAEVVEKPLPGDFERGLRLHKALADRMREFQLYGRDIGKEAYLKVVSEVQLERMTEKQKDHLDETT